MFIRILIIACLCTLTTVASANPFFIGRFGGVTAGPLNDGAFATYWNPAGLASDGARLQMHLLAVNRHATFDRIAEGNEVPPHLVGVNSGENITGALGVVPSLAFKYGFSKGELDLGLGTMVFIDRAGRTNWRKNLAGALRSLIP